MRNSAFSFTIWFFTITLLRHNVFRRNDFQSFRVFYRHFLIWFPVLEIFFHEAQLFMHSYTHVPAVFILSRQIIGFLVNCFTPFSSFDSVLQTNPVCFFFFYSPCVWAYSTHTHLCSDGTLDAYRHRLSFTCKFVVSKAEPSPVGGNETKFGCSAVQCAC